MFKRFSNRQLIIVFGSLLGLYLLSMVAGGKTTRTFKKTISALDTTLVSEIRITPSGEITPVVLSKSEGEWMVRLSGNNEGRTGKNMVTNALRAIAFLDARQLVSRSKDKWNEYKVDSSGTHIEVFSGEKKSLDLILGRYEFKQTGMMSYIRENGESEVYLVDGFLESTFNRNSSEWRDKTILQGPQSAWMSVSFVYPADSSFQLVKGADNNWVMSDSSAVNTAAVTQWLGTASTLNGSVFADGYSVSGNPLFQMIVQTTAGPVEIRAYEDATHTWVLTSTLNPGVFFADKAGEIVKKLFVGKNTFDSENG
ncbi:MAG: DUF4340 domain-containing protein [Bacteroidia bacterium]